MGAFEGALAFLAAQGSQILPGAGIFGGSAAVTLGTMGFVISRLPDNYLARTEPGPFLPGRSQWVRVGAKIGKNALGGALVMGGVLMIPKLFVISGALTIATGVVLLDVPGKHRAVRRIFAIPRVLTMANRVRARFGKAPLARPTQG